MIIAQLQRDPIVNLYIKHPVVLDSIQFPRTAAPTAAAADDGLRLRCCEAACAADGLRLRLRRCCCCGR